MPIVAWERGAAMFSGQYCPSPVRFLQRQQKRPPHRDPTLMVSSPHLFARLVAPVPTTVWKPVREENRQKPKSLLLSSENNCVCNAKSCNAKSSADTARGGYSSAVLPNWEGVPLPLLWKVVSCPHVHSKEAGTKQFLINTKAALPHYVGQQVRSYSFTSNQWKNNYVHTHTQNMCKHFSYKAEGSRQRVWNVLPPLRGLHSMKHLSQFPLFLHSQQILLSSESASFWPCRWRPYVCLKCSRSPGPNIFLYGFLMHQIRDHLFLVWFHVSECIQVSINTIFDSSQYNL